jgi:hypothetical protein
MGKQRYYSVRRGAGWDRPEAACPPGGRAAAGEAGSFNPIEVIPAVKSRQQVKAAKQRWRSE